MTALKAFVTRSTLALVAAGLSLAPSAGAQTAKQTSLAKPAAATSWACTFKTVEIAPVSLDIRGEATAWVMVHRVNGEVVAAERVSEKEVQQIRRLPCQGDRIEAPPPLVG